MWLISDISRPIVQGCVITVMLLLSGVAAVMAARNEQARNGNTESFEVDSVKPAQAPLIPMSKISFLPGGRFQANAVLKDVISYAYGLQPNQHIRGVSSVLDERFAIAATAREGMTLTKGEQLRLVQRLLADRFRLSVHFEEESQTVSVLWRANATTLGPHLRRLKEGCAAMALPPDANLSLPRQPQCHVTFINGRFTAIVEQISDIARFLSVMGRRPIVDETELIGAYEVEMTFNPATLVEGSGTASTTLEDLPALSDSLRRELGLRLETARRRVPVLVVDRVDKPTDN